MGWESVELYLLYIYDFVVEKRKKKKKLLRNPRLETEPN